MVRPSFEQRVSSRSPFAFSRPMPWGLMTVGHAPEFIEVTHQEQLVLSWRRVECVSDDLVNGSFSSSG